jgi:hypothetical protein
VLGKQGQQLIVVDRGTYHRAQKFFSYEQISSFPGDGEVPMWYIGAEQDTTAGPCQCWTFQPTTYQTVLRQGNFDWVSQKQRWHGIGGSGATDASAPQIIQNSLYLSSKPAFFGGNTWPWVDPSTGTTYTLPAKARFDAGTYNQV